MLAETQLNNKTVYIVDDEPDSRRLISSIVQRMGAQVSIFTNGEDILSAAQNQPADLYILDVMMPKMDGWTVMEALRREPAHESTPIIFTTSLFNQLEANRLNQDDKPCKIVAKPITYEAIVSIVDQFFD